MTGSQQRRQRHRDQVGRYDKVNPCYVCDKTAGENYGSHHDTDGAINDELICLCKPCHKFLDQFDGKTAIKIAGLIQACREVADTIRGGDKYDSLEPWAQELI